MAGCHSHSSLLYSTTRLIIYHNPSYSSYRIVVAVALLLVLFCRRVRLTASFACACRRFVTRKSFAVSRPTMSEPLRVCGRPSPCAPCAPRSTGTRSARTARRLLQRGLPCTPKHVKSPRRLYSGPLSSPRPASHRGVNSSPVVHFLLESSTYRVCVSRAGRFRTKV